MADQDALLDEKMTQLKLSYAENLPQKIKDIATGWQKLKADWQKPLAEEVYRAVHSLCGSSGSYGAAGVNKHARGMERHILSIIYDDREPESDEIKEFELLLRRTEKAVKNWVPIIKHGIQSEHLTKSNEQKDKSASTIFILDDDKEFTVPLVGEMEKNLYLSRIFSAKQKFMEACKHERPALIIMDSKFALGSGPGADTLDDLRKILPTLPPIFFVSTKDDMQARLEMVRTGARRYFQKPVDLQQLIESFSHYFLIHHENKSRILVVDDDVAIGKLHVNVLENAGIKTKLVTDPLTVMGEIKSFKPDLILMDVHMPGCNGFELAAVIRQDVQCDDVFILFLSADLDIEKYLKSAHLAGEEFLTKPIEPDWLVLSIKARLERSRFLRQNKSDLKISRDESRFRELALDQHAIVSIANAEGVITYVNSKFCEISGYTKEELIGQDHNIVNSGYHSEEFFEDMWQTIVSGQVWHGEINNLKKSGKIYWVASTIVPFLDAEGLPYQYVSMRTDVTEIKRLELEVSRHAELLDSLHAAMTGFMSAGQFNNVVGLLLDNMMRLTGSDYGIMAEVLFDGDTPFLKAHAVKNIHWTEEIQNKYDLQYQEGPKLEAQYDILSAVYNTGEVIISEDLSNDPQGNVLPGVENKLNKFLGVPVYYGDQLVGIYAFARQSKSFSADSVSFLDAFNATYGVMIHAKRIAEMEEEVNFFLDQARKEAETASSAKSDFLSSMSHELRTPLNVILGFAQLMLADTGQELSETQKENAEEIHRAGHHLLDLVNEVLDLSRIEAGQLDITIQSVEIEAIVGDCIGLVRTLADNKNITLEYIRDEYENKKIAVDVTRMNQALINLLSNAVKYTPSKGKILVACSETNENYLRITVSDSGPGIQKEYLDQLFTPFNRLGAEEGDEEGTGIGLVISKNLIEKMGGSVGYMESKYGGASFWIELPVDRTVDAIDNTSVNETQEEYAPAIENKVPPVRYKILYIEDNQANLNLVKQLLGRRPNIELLTADEPNYGLEIIESNDLDAVLLDINLPIMSGYEVLAKLRENEKTKNLPVIAVSANAMPADIQNGRDAGFDDYITKPIQLDQFFAVLDRVLPG